MKNIQKICVMIGILLSIHLHGASEDVLKIVTEKKEVSNQKTINKAGKLYADVQALQIHYVYPVLSGTEGTSFNYDPRYAALSDLSKTLRKNEDSLEAIMHAPDKKRLRNVAASIRAGVHNYYQVSRKHYADMTIAIEDPVIVVPSEMEDVEKRCAKILQHKEKKSLEK